MEEEVINYDPELAELNLKENTFAELDEKEDEKEDGIGEVKESDEFYKEEEGVE